ncbi:N-acetylglucosamine transport system permease protein [Lachnospiraceae bacterium G11]|nr:N-acetylglucosamine transport system permease protein [Lachnospiraceae bacterium G11]
MKKKPTLFIAVCLIPTLLLTIGLMVIPMCNAVYLSFTDSTALSTAQTRQFIGLENYIYMFKDKSFIQALGNTMKLLLVVPVVTLFFSLIFAFLLTQSRIREKGFYRSVFFFPSVISLTVVGIIWSFVFNPTKGILNHILAFLKLENLQHAWLGESKTALWCVAAALIWQAAGYYMVMYIASIDGISEEVYEAAAIDGAGAFQKFKCITVPLLRNTIGITYVLALSGTINLSFTLSNVMTAGGPNGASSVLLQYMYTQGMRNANYGYSMSIAMFTLLMAIILAVISRKVTHNNEG